MTDRIPYCPKCQNEGYIQHLNYASTELFGHADRLKPLPILTSVSEIPCDCWYAQNRANMLAASARIAKLIKDKTNANNN